MTSVLVVSWVLSTHSELLAICHDAGVAQLVESQLPKLVVASSNLVARSKQPALQSPRETEVVHDDRGLDAKQG